MKMKFTFASSFGKAKETIEVNTVKDLLRIMRKYDEPIILFPKRRERRLNKANFVNEEEYWDAYDNRFYKDFSDITLMVYNDYIE